MADSSYHQSSFLGGVWGPLSQGRSEHPLYKQALNVSTNGITVEEGAWARRSGFEFLGTSRGRTTAKLRPFVAGDATPFVLEFTDNHLRFWSGTARVFDNTPSNITASSLSSGILSLTLDSVHNIVVGDDIMVYCPNNSYTAIAPIRNRTLRVLTSPGGGVITVGDDKGNALTGLTMASNSLVGFLVYRVYDLSAPWSGDGTILGLRVVQAEDKAFVLSSGTLPYLLKTLTNANGDTDATFSLAVSNFKDGPYLDPQGTADTPETGTVSAYTGSITFTPTTTTFSSTDVGRLIRLFSQPAAWNSATTYNYGDTVTYNNQWWKSIASGAYATNNVNVVPGTLYTTSGGIQVAVWAPAPTEGQWAWGKITAQATTSCTVSLTTNLNSKNGTTISTWRLGVYTSGQYPTCGVFHEGRLWLAGAVANRFDASITNGLQSDGSVIFSPTDVNGLVLDSSGISETISANEAALIYWMAPDHQGILVGTLTGEWLISASVLNDPLTPLTIQAHKITRYQCANIEPVRAGMALVFVQRYTRRVLEYLADAFSGRFTARHLNEFAKHLTEAGVVDIAFQEETVPVVWCSTGDGNIAGCTYRRVSRFVTEAPVVQAWHKHVLGGDYNQDVQRFAESICTAADAKGSTSDLLYVSSYADVNGVASDYFIEVLRPMLEEA